MDALRIPDLDKTVEAVVATLRRGSDEKEFLIARRNMKRFATRAGDLALGTNEMILLYAAMKAVSSKPSQRCNVVDLREMARLVSRYESIHPRHGLGAAPLPARTGSEASDSDADDMFVYRLYVCHFSF
jgi:hypothetical protein